MQCFNWDIKLHLVCYLTWQSSILLTPSPDVAMGISRHHRQKRDDAKKRRQRLQKRRLSRFMLDYGAPVYTDKIASDLDAVTSKLSKLSSSSDPIPLKLWEAEAASDMDSDTSSDVSPIEPASFYKPTSANSNTDHLSLQDWALMFKNEGEYSPSWKVCQELTADFLEEMDSEKQQLEASKGSMSETERELLSLIPKLRNAQLGSEAFDDFGLMSRAWLSTLSNHISAEGVWMPETGREHFKDVPWLFWQWLLGKPCPEDVDNWASVGWWSGTPSFVWINRWRAGQLYARERLPPDENRKKKERVIFAAVNDIKVVNMTKTPMRVAGYKTRKVLLNTWEKDRDNLEFPDFDSSGTLTDDESRPQSRHSIHNEEKAVVSRPRSRHVDRDEEMEDVA
jgi:hypothetical protein